MKTILIVDDSESILEVVKYTLTNEGYDVVCGKDGLDALEKLKDIDPDLIITDLHMPNMDGIGLIKEVRTNSKFPRVPILFLTTETQNDKKMEAKAAGATGWIIKPFVPSKLLMAVQKVIR